MLTYSFFKNKRVTVFGLGLNSGGVGVVKFLAAAGAREIIVTDIKAREELAPSIEALKAFKNVTYVLGQHRPEDFSGVDLVIKNPIVPWTNEYVRLAQKNKVPVEMDSSIFFALCKAPIVGITGSKGKTSTSELIAHVLKGAGKKVVRVGTGAVSVLGRLSQITSDSIVVFELSSWRLSALPLVKRSPEIAVITNIFPDHLNYYRTLAAYIDDKKNIFRFQKKTDVLIANGDDETVRTMTEEAVGIVRLFSRKEEAKANVWVQDHAIYGDMNGTAKAIVALSDIRVAGDHAVANALAATGVALTLGITKEAIATGIRTFHGVPHRLERVGEKDGITYYNDTTATIPEAAIASLETFDRPVILLAGGTDKRLEFAVFAKEIMKRAKAVVLFHGSATEKILTELRVLSTIEKKERTFAVVKSMEEALRVARTLAEPGDVILLSPGATSFGIFQNEFDRGEQFKKFALE